MSQNNLIKKCVCGNTENFIEVSYHNIECYQCCNCGVIHASLKNWSEEKYLNFYVKDYHDQYMKIKEVITYQERYEHDQNISRLRLEQYKDFIKSGMKGIDVGSSNSAFVHTCRERNIDCIGLEPGEHIGDNNLTLRETLQTADLQNNEYDFITLHDSIEHMIDVNSSLEKIYDILKKEGIAIIDLPDFFNPSGYHHWKAIEHLWYFKKEQFVMLLTNKKFIIEKITNPIPGKLVFYIRK